MTDVLIFAQIVVQGTRRSYIKHLKTHSQEFQKKLVCAECGFKPSVDVESKDKEAYEENACGS